MQVPNLASAVVPQAKLADYLLSPTHPDGRHKAVFFTAVGFSRENWQELETALRQHLATHQVAKIEDSPFGKRYVVEGIMDTPDGRTPGVRSIWMIRNEQQVPQFISAYPL